MSEERERERENDEERVDEGNKVSVIDYIRRPTQSPCRPCAVAPQPVL
jgi:hypothetical protein